LDVPLLVQFGEAARDSLRPLGGAAGNALDGPTMNPLVDRIGRVLRDSLGCGRQHRVSSRGGAHHGGIGSNSGADAGQAQSGSFHSRTVPSLLPDAASFPSAATASASTTLVW